MWDAEADGVVASILDHGQVGDVNRRLRGWTHNDQPVPTGLPEHLQAFLERARRLPPWADQAALARAADFMTTNATFINLVHGLGGGLLCAANPDLARAMYCSRRVAVAATLGYEVGRGDAFQPHGRMVVTAVKTRLAHAAVRHLLPRCPQWNFDTPLSQDDLLAMWHALPTYAIRTLNRWRIAVTRLESEAYLHAWQVTAHLIGVADAMIPASWDEARAQLVNIEQRSSRAGIAMAGGLVDTLTEDAGPRGLSRPLANAVGRFIVGDRVADWDGIAREPFWDPVVRTTFPALVEFHAGQTPRSRVPPIAWVIDEAIRQHHLVGVARVRATSIELPWT